MRAAFVDDGRAPPDEESVQKVVGLSLEEAIGTLWKGALPPDRSRLAGRYREAFRKPAPSGYRAGPLFPGVSDGLAALRRQGIPMGIVTGKSAEGMRVVFEDHDLRDHFVVVETADLHPSKPDPSMVLTAAERSQVDPSRTWVIGDTTYDIEMARSAGARAIGVEWGNHPSSALRAAGADAVLGDFLELIGLVETARGGLPSLPGSRSAR